AYFRSLAHHYNAAGRAADALRNGLRLAQIQMRQDEHALAKRSFERLLKALLAVTTNSTTLQIQFEARLGLAEIKEAAGNSSTALTGLSEPDMSNTEMPDAAVQSSYFAILGRLNCALGNEEIGQSYIRRATGKGLMDESCLWQPSDRILEFIHILGGNFRAASNRLENARETAHRRGLVADKTAMSAMLCLLQAARGAADAAIAEAQTATDQASQLGDTRLMAASMHVMGVTHTWCGDASRALHAFDNAIELAGQNGDLPRLYSIYGYRGQAQAIAGRYVDAITDLDVALSMGTMLDLRYSRPLFQAWKAAALAATGDRDSALPEARTALKMATAANRPWAYSVGMRAMACALAQPNAGNFSGAERAIRTALSEQATLGLEFERAQSLVTYARILRSAGETQRSAGLIRQAKNLLRQIKTVMNRKSVRGMTAMLCTPCNASS
ncbi:MAG: hypothetical protein ACTSW2_02060, partial [Alphaproteobacteria bacterium]